MAGAGITTAVPAQKQSLPAILQNWRPCGTSLRWHRKRMITEHRLVWEKRTSIRLARAWSSFFLSVGVLAWFAVLWLANRALVLTRRFAQLKCLSRKQRPYR